MVGTGRQGSEMRSPLVGRVEELARLDQALEQALRYETPQSVLVVGSQGTGKSKLVDHWLRAVRASHPMVRVLSAAGEEGDSGYAVFRRLLARRFPFPDRDDAEAALRAQVEEVVHDRRLTEFIHFLGAFVGVAVGDNPFLRTLEEDPQRHDQIARSVLRRFLELDAARSPVVIAIDDLHWGDQQTLSLLSELAETLGGVPIVIVAAARLTLLSEHPELGELGGEHTLIELGPLTDAEAEQLMQQLLGWTDRIPVELLDVALETTGGNPLFIGRLLRLLVDDGVIELDGQGRAIIDVAAVVEVELPMSVEDAVAARIGALSPAERDVLEKASVLGGVFWLGALVCLTRLQQEVERDAELWIADVLEATITEILDELVERDYLLRMPDSSIPGELEYAFKHNIEREQIRRRIGVERARQYHLFAAQWVESRVADRSQDQLEYLGQHYEKGGNNHRAAFCFLHAADRARARFANTQAIQFYRRGLGLLDVHNALAKIEGLQNLGEVCELLGRNPDAEQHFAEMLHFAWLLDHKEKGARAHHMLGRLRRDLGDFDCALRHLSMALKLFEAGDCQGGVAEALDELGRLAWMRGAYQQALEYHQEALRRRRDDGDERGIPVSLNNIGRVHQDAGAVDHAERFFNESLEQRKALGDRIGVVDSLSMLGGLHRSRSDYSRAFELWTNALHLAREIGDRPSETDLMIKISEALIQLGRLREAEQHLTDAAALAADLGNRRLKAECQRIVAEVYLSLGQLEAARQAATFALETTTELKLDPQRAGVLLLLAQISAAEGAGEERRTEARGLFGEAIALFEHLGNQPELARALSSLADFHERCGEPVVADECRERADRILADRRGQS